MPGDALEVPPQPAQVDEGGAFSGVDWDAYLLMGKAFTLTRSGRPVVCAGAHLALPGVVEGWAMVGAEAGRGALLPAVRGIGAFLYDLPWADVRRVQTTVRLDFAAGHRMARLLGFVREGTLRRYGPGGSDFVMYAKV